MTAIIQRPLRGSRISTFYPVKNLPSLASLDSAFQLQEYISLLIRLDVHDVDSIVSLPGSSKDANASNEREKELQPDSSREGEKKSEITVDEACWIYEQLRRLAQDLSHPLITTLQQECTRASCPEMKAGEWLYLCVAHGNDGAMEQCCAIDYILHTVDSATALLNSPRTFPSRLQIPQTSHRHFSSLARRLGRIFAHAYFHHREAFEQAEAESSLYARFLALTAKFDLVPAEFLVIPSAQFMGEDSGSVHERDLSLRGYTDSRQYYPPQLREEDHNRLSAPAGQKHIQQQQLGVGRMRNPNPPSPPESGNNGGIGEHPTSASRSRFGRSRTDTMVFAEGEANAFADELAAKARASEAEDEHEGPKTARPSVEAGQESNEAEVEPAGESETHFEISLSPDEELPVSFENTPSLPTPPEAEIELEKDVAAAPSILAEPVPALDISPVEPETTHEPEETPSVPDAEEKEDKVVDEAIPDIVPAEEVKAPDPVMEEPSPVSAPQPVEKSDTQDIPIADTPAKAAEAEPVSEPPVAEASAPTEEPAPPAENGTTEASPASDTLPPPAESSTATPEEPVTEVPALELAPDAAHAVGAESAHPEVEAQELPTAEDPVATVIESSAVKPLEPPTEVPEPAVNTEDTSALPAITEAHIAAAESKD